MKSLYVFVLVSLCHALAQKTSLYHLSAPSILSVKTLDPPSVEVSWNKIESGDDSDPVIGYKVKIWEVKKIKTTTYNITHGQIGKTEIEKEPPINNEHEPEGVPVEILTSAEETKAVFSNVKLNVTYEIRVRAYTKARDGEMSNAVRIKLDE